MGKMFDPASSDNYSNPIDKKLSLIKRISRFAFGAPRSLYEKGLFKSISLLPFLAWVGLGADGLSSSSYGPEEAFRTLGSHSYLAVGLAILTAGTVFLIALAYSRIIEAFPFGGGGYVVATKLLGKKTGVISGCALLVDYVLTIAVSVASAGDALFSFLPLPWGQYKIIFDIMLIFGLTTLNIRGVKESVLILLPMFLLFLVTHFIAIGGGIFAHANHFPQLASDINSGISTGVQTIGIGGLLLLLMHAYSMGGGTYTGIEAVSNGLPIIREPRVHNAKKTMLYMALSLAITAGGLILCYLLWNINSVPGKTMNAVLLETMTSGLKGAAIFVIITLISEGVLLIVAAQAGFIDGPRVLANMAIDSWVPHHFAALSERLTTRNGIFLMGISALAILLYTQGDVRHLVVMYSINVFLTFTLSMLGMLKHTYKSETDRKHRRRRVPLFLTGFMLCSAILLITITQKFTEGGWITLCITACVVILVFLIHNHYQTIAKKIVELYAQIESALPKTKGAIGQLNTELPTAAVLVSSYGGLGIHTVLNILRSFPNQYANFIFISIGVINSGSFKGEGSIEKLRELTESNLKKYVDLGQRLGIPSVYKLGIGLDIVEETDKICRQIVQEFPRTTFFAGKVIFEKERWYQRLLHNETAFAIQNRLFRDDQTLVILPAKVY